MLAEILEVLAEMLGKLEISETLAEISEKQKMPKSWIIVLPFYIGVFLFSVLSVAQKCNLECCKILAIDEFLPGISSNAFLVNCWASYAHP